MTVYTNVFGGTTLYPSDVSYLALSLTVVFNDYTTGSYNMKGTVTYAGLAPGDRRRWVEDLLTSLADGPGTWVVEEEPGMEQALIRGVALDTGGVKITLDGVPDQPGVAARVFRAIADSGVGVDMIVQNVSRAGHTDVSFTVPKDDLARIKDAIAAIVADSGAAGSTTDDGIAKVSIVGAGCPAGAELRRSSCSSLPRSISMRAISPRT